MGKKIIEDINIDDISFKSENYIFQSKNDEVCIWHSEEGDGLGIFFFNLEPDLPKENTNLEFLKEFYQKQLSEVNGFLVELEYVELDNCKAIKLIMKLPQEPTGLIYLISFTLPYKNFSFVIKAQCSEYGTTGVKETILVTRYLGSGGKMEDLQKFNFDDIEYDKEFTEHPIARARKIEKDILKGIKISDKIKEQQPFYY